MEVTQSTSKGIIIFHRERNFLASVLPLAKKINETENDIHKNLLNGQYSLNLPSLKHSKNTYLLFTFLYNK